MFKSALVYLELFSQKISVKHFQGPEDISDHGTVDKMFPVISMLSIILQSLLQNNRRKLNKPKH